MTNRSYDAIVVGLGAMGSATTYHLARRGLRVLGLEMFQPGHDQGSSHGHHRMIRKSTFSDAGYVPLADRALALWRELEEESGQSLLSMIGEIWLLDPLSQPDWLPGIEHSIQRGFRTLVDKQDLAERFPGCRPREGMIALYEAEAGYLRVEAGVVAHIDLAQKHRAIIHPNEEVIGWERDGNGVRVDSRLGTYTARHLVLTTGPWAAELLRELSLPLQVKRVINAFFRPTRPDWWAMESGAPDFMLDVPEGSFYGMPAVGDIGFKIGNSAGTETTARTVRRTIDDAEINVLRNALDTYLPGASGPLMQQITCMCTYTPDRNFIVDRHPSHEQVLVACGFSGRGYKFAPTMGEILADLVVAGETDHDIAFMATNRFAAMPAVD
jgi:sarcosine oxidase